MKTTLPRRLPSLLPILLLTSCATGQITRETTFSPASDQALVVLGVDVASSFKSPRLEFRSYDPATGKADARPAITAIPRKEQVTAGQKIKASLFGLEAGDGGHEYFLIEMPAGYWILSSVTASYGGRGTNYVSHSVFQKGTIGFEVKPGSAVYIGEYQITGSYGGSLGIARMRDDLPAAQAEIATYANVEQELAPLDPQAKTFTCQSKKVLLGTINCDPASIIVQAKQP
jgi:hypothetical protein